MKLYPFLAGPARKGIAGQIEASAYITEDFYRVTLPAPGTYNASTLNIYIYYIDQWPKSGTLGSPMAKTGYSLPRWSQGAILLANSRPDPTLAEFQTGPPDSGYSSLYQLPDFNHTYPIMAGLFDQQPTCLTRHRVIAGRGGSCDLRDRACGRTLTLLCSLYVIRLSLTRVTKSYLLALGTTLTSSYFTKH